MSAHHQGSYPPIADYGIIGAMHTCALVSKSGSIDWLCMPSFDSPSVFGRMLDWRRGGFFQIVPDGVQSVTRRYLPGTNVLETSFQTDTGTATLTDFMVVRRQDTADAEDSSGWPSAGVGIAVHQGDSLVPSVDATLDTVEAQFRPRVVRTLACTEGTVSFRMDCRPRFDYGTVVPHATLLEPDGETSSYGYARGGGNAISVYCHEPMHLHDHGFQANGALKTGENVSTVVSHQPFFLPAAEAFDDKKIESLRERTVTFWEDWASRCTYQGEYRDDVLRSALALKALTYEPSGALLAAATTSLPEQPAGERNWDYRFTWIRDATFSLEALHNLGYWEEARGFKRWLEWTAAYPEDLQIMYGLRGERWLTEVELPLEGYRWSSPARVGNGAFSQFQLDIYGEILDSAFIYRKMEPPGANRDDWEFASEDGSYVTTDPDYWEFLSAVVEFVIENWRRPDAGIWETRGGYRHFLYSKVMCWVALDRGVKIGQELLAEENGAEKFNISDELFERWSAVRDEIRQDILANGYDPNYRSGQGAFVQSYGSKSLDASALMLPLVGFIEADDPMMRSTIDAIRRDLTSPQGFVYRYKGFDDGLEGDEGTFIICSFWLVRNLIALGEIREAQTLFETLRGYTNDLGLLSEEINADTGEMLGNFPQAFSHLALIDNAVELSRVKSSQGTPVASPT